MIDISDKTCYQENLNKKDRLTLIYRKVSVEVYVKKED